MPRIQVDYLNDDIEARNAVAHVAGTSNLTVAKGSDAKHETIDCADDAARDALLAALVPVRAITAKVVDGGPASPQRAPGVGSKPTDADVAQQVSNQQRFQSAPPVPAPPAGAPNPNPGPGPFPGQQPITGLKPADGFTVQPQPAKK